jgi:putative CocE/NonD family hydrolase
MASQIAVARVSSGWFGLLSKRLGLPEPVVQDVRCERDVRVPMRDGAELLADRWVPEGAVLPPLLLVRTPYGRRAVNGLLYGRFFAHQGFQVVMQSCRGTAGSGGDFSTPFVAERQDGADTVAWLSDQSWYPGSFATIGGSYLGYTQLALAEAAGKELSAAVLQIAPTSLGAIAWNDGALCLGTALGWAAGVQRGPDKLLRTLLAHRPISRAVRRAGREAPLLRSYTQATRRPVPYFEDWITHSDVRDPWWQSVDQSSALDVIECPVLVQAGWFDTFLENGLEQYERLTSRGVAAELSVGPWTHASFTLKGAGENLADAVQFLRRTMSEPATPPKSPVRLTEIGSGRRIELPVWPPSGAVDRTWHLAAAGRLLDEPESQGPTRTSFVYDPADPTPALGGPTLADDAGPRDNRELEQRADVVVFTTQPFEQDQTLLGAPRVDLWVGSDRHDTCVFLRLCVVDAEGTSTNVCDRMVPLRSADRTPDGHWHVAQSLPATALALPTGARVRLQVSSGAYPTYARHPGSAEPPATAVVFHPARQTVHHGAGRESTLSLPLQVALPVS